MFAIEAIGLQKSFGPRQVLQGVELQVQLGEFVALFGPNGAGKTTLIRILAGLIRPSAGSVLLGEYNLAKEEEAARRQIGVMGHQTYLYDDLTAEENLVFYARMYGLHNPAGCIATLLKQMGLWARRRDPVRTYSRGMQQRLALARALLHDPPILLLDEPDTGLDLDAIPLLQEALVGSDGGRRAVLFTTHNLERGLELADRVAILSGGRIVYWGERAVLSNEGFRQLYARFCKSAPQVPEPARGFSENHLA